MQLQPYLFFDGRCEEAIEFYKKTLGAKVEMLMRIKDSPEPPPPDMCPPGSENKIMHLGAGGQVQMPMAKTFFSPRFGMVADRFGVSWMVIVAPQP